MQSKRKQHKAAENGRKGKEYDEEVGEKKEERQKEGRSNGPKHHYMNMDVDPDDIL